MQQFCDCFVLWYNVQKKVFAIQELEYREAKKKGEEFANRYLAMNQAEKQNFEMNLRYTLENLPSPPRFAFDSNGSLKDMVYSESESEGELFDLDECY